MNPKVRAAIEFLEASSGRQLLVDELANYVHLSRSRLFYLFKMGTGMSPLQYLKTIRMREACQLLENSLASIKQVSAMVGYTDESHFLREFKKVYGVTPSQYRAQYIPLILAKISLQENRRNG